MTTAILSLGLVELTFALLLLRVEDSVIQPCLGAISKSYALSMAVSGATLIYDSPQY